jgi:hypothetical protein
MLIHKALDVHTLALLYTHSTSAQTCTCTHIEPLPGQLHSAVLPASASSLQATGQWSGLPRPLLTHFCDYLSPDEDGRGHPDSASEPDPVSVGLRRVQRQNTKYPIKSEFQINNK